MSTLKRRIFGRCLGIFLTLLGLIFGSILTAAPAQAYTKLCGNYGDIPSFSCVAFSGFSGQRPWGYPADSKGHNCTNYATYRLWKNGVGNPGNLGYAKDWDNKASAYGILVNTSPAVGSIAQWEANVAPAGSSGHVAYVDTVTSTYIDISEDNYGGTTMTKRLYPAQAGWPSHFIHFEGTTTPTPPPPPAVHYEKPAAIELPNGQVDTFVITPDGNVELKYWNDNTGFSTWMNWGNPGVSLVDSPASVLRGDNELHVFVRGSNNHLYERYWAADEGLSPWIDWGGTGVASTPAAALLDEKIHVWVRGTDGVLYEQYQTPTGLSGWMSWGKPSSTSGLAYDPVVSIGVGGSVQVYSAGSDYHLYERYRGSDGILSPWIDWGGTGVRSTPAVLQEGGASNKVAVWVVGTDGNLWERYWTNDGFSSWIDWGNPGVGLFDSPAVMQDSTPEANGQIDVWVRGSDNHLYERYWSMTTSSLSQWVDWGGTGVASTPAVIQKADGKIDIFIQGTDRHLWEQYWTSAGMSGWIDWGY